MHLLPTYQVRYNYLNRGRELLFKLVFQGGFYWNFPTTFIQNIIEIHVILFLKYVKTWKIKDILN